MLHQLRILERRELHSLPGVELVVPRRYALHLEPAVLIGVRALVKIRLLGTDRLRHECHKTAGSKLLIGPRHTLHHARPGAEGNVQGLTGHRLSQIQSFIEHFLGPHAYRLQVSAFRKRVKTQMVFIPRYTLYPERAVVLNPCAGRSGRHSFGRLQVHGNALQVCPLPAF